MPIITLTTDFGTSDGYVGAIKGVIATVAPHASVIDIAHDVPRHDIAHAAWIMKTATRRFPAGTIHLAVVDPGVGGSRNPVIGETGGQLYVGPDNGTFAYLAIVTAWRIENAEYLAHDISSTFHGRDIFAPVAAALANGVAASKIGPQISLVGKLPWGPRPEREGRIVHIDHYGNLVSDLPQREAGDAITIAGRRLAIVKAYEDVPKSELLAYVGSAHTIEVAVRDGRADRVLQATRGMKVMPAAPQSSEHR